MNFVWFIAVLIIFEILFWYYIFMILGIPGMPTIVLLGYATDNIWRKWVKWFLLPIAVVVAFIFGTFLPVFVYGGTLALIARHFVANASYPWIYWGVCGFAAFYIMAPSGETSMLVMFLSLASFLVVTFSNPLKGILEFLLAIVGSVWQFIIGVALLALMCYGVWRVHKWVLRRIFSKE